MKIGTVLFTRDGRKIGNAIVIANGTFKLKDGTTFEANYLETDFGNNPVFTDMELAEFFYPPIIVRDVNHWFNDRDKLRGDYVDDAEDV